MDLLLTPSTSLFHYCLKRYVKSVSGYLVVLAAYVFYCPTELVKDPPLALKLSFAFVVISILARVGFIYSSRKYVKDEAYEAFLKKQYSLQFWFVSLALVSAVAWSLLFCLSIQYLGAFSKESLFVYVLGFFFCMNSAVVYYASGWFSLGFDLIILGTPAIYSAILDPPRSIAYAIGVFVGIYFLYRSGKDTHVQTTELFAAHDLQKQQSEYFQSIIEAFPGMVTIFDENLHYRLVNSRVTQFLDLPKEKLMGQKLTNNMTNDFEVLVNDFSKSNLPSFQSRLQLQSRQHPRWYLITLNRLPDRSHIVVSMDIHDLILAEQDAEDQRASAEASARLASIGELAAGIAHEINNPLAVITAKSEQLMRKLHRQGVLDFMQDLEKIRDTAYRIAKIVKGLKNMSRNGDNEPFVSWSLKTICQDVLSIFEAKLRGFSIKVEIDIDETIFLDCRPTQIGQVLLNLVSNSFDVLKNSPNSWLKISGAIHDGWVEISVTDSGPKIPDDVRKKLMTPFFTTKATGVGTGLGLSISRRIANDHQGVFFLDDHCANTRFVLRIPQKQFARVAA